MTATAGWYPDPGGRPGLFRYWDGRAWSAATTQHPATATPPMAPSGPTISPPVVARRSPVGWILGVVALVVVIALVAVGVRLFGSSTTTAADPPATAPAGSPSVPPTPEAQCPPQSSPLPSQEVTENGRVTSGKLSYPTLPAPFGNPKTDDRVPFGKDVRSQTYTIENASNGKTPWAAAVTIATLTAGDGFYGPEQGAKLVARCIVGTFYGDNEITRKDTRSQATTVDGHQAWLIEAQLSYRIPDIRATSELLLVLVVDTEDGNAGLFYGSVPDTGPTLVAPTRNALAQLRVS